MREAHCFKERVNYLKKTITTVLLLLLIIEAAAGTLLIGSEVRRLRDESRAQLTEAEERLARAKTELEAIAPDTVEGEEHQLVVEQAIVDDAIAKAQELEAENTSLDGDIARAKAELDAAREQDDNAYYQTVYDALKKGMELVEGYIEGN